MKKIVVIGDSHTRAFSGSDLFLPFFLGAGKEHCFISDQKARNVKIKLIELIRKINDELNLEDYMLVFGEPDTRWYLGRGWYPWRRRIVNPLIYYRRIKLLEASLDRYLDIVDSILEEFSGFQINLIVYGNTSVYEKQIGMARIWNKMLDKECQSRQIHFINVLDSICHENGKVMAEYVNDISHANQKVIPLVVNQLRIQYPWLDEVSVDFKEMDHSLLKDMFEYNERFGSYMERK